MVSGCPPSAKRKRACSPRHTRAPLPLAYSKFSQPSSKPTVSRISPLPTAFRSPKKRWELAHRSSCQAPPTRPNLYLPVQEVWSLIMLDVSQHLGKNTDRQHRLDKLRKKRTRNSSLRRWGIPVVQGLWKPSDDQLHTMLTGYFTKNGALPMLTAAS